MDILEWLPPVLVAPTFAFLGYWMWRHLKANGGGRLPRTIAEVRQVDGTFQDEFAAAGRKLRWFNLWLVLAIVIGVVAISILTQK